MKKCIISILLSACSIATIVNAQCPLTAPVIKGPNVVCVGTQTTYFAELNTPAFFSWSINGGGSIFNLNSHANIAWNTPGTFQISVTPLFIPGCSVPLAGTFSVTVVNSSTIPAPTLISGPQAACPSSGPLTYTVPAIAGNTPVWFLEFNNPPYYAASPPTLTPSGNQVTINWAGASIGQYSLFASYSNGTCSGAQSALLISLTTGTSTPTLYGNTTDKYCLNQSGSFYAYGDPQDVFTWSLPSGGGTLVTTGNSASVQWTSQGTFTITAVATNSCSSIPRSITKTISVGSSKPSTPGLITAANPTLCLNSVQTFSVPVQAGVTSYNWDFATNGTDISPTSSTNNIPVTLSKAGDYNVAVKASNGYCESDPSAATFTVLGTPPTPTINGTQFVCAGSAATLTATPALSGNSYTWDTAGGQIDPPESGSTINVRWSTVGSKPIFVKATNQCGISSLPSASLPFVVNVQTSAISIADIQGTTDVCTDLYYYSTSSVINASTLSWSLSGGGTVSPPSASPSLNQVTSVNWTTPGMGYVLTVTASNACGTNVSKSISVNVKSGIKPISSLINGIPSEVICATSNPTIKNYSVPLVSGYSYVWELLNPNGNILSSSGNTATVTWSQSGLTGIAVTPYTASCYGEKMSLYPSYNIVPTMTSPSVVAVCKGVPINIPLTASAPTSYFNWIANDNPHTDGESLTLQYSSIINNSIGIDYYNLQQVVTYTVTPHIGTCTGSPQTISVTVVPNPTMTSLSTTTVCDGTALNIPLTSSVPSAYKWIAANNLNTTGESLTLQDTDKINNTITNNTTSAQSVTYIVTPTSTTASCLGTSQTVIAQVNPKPAMTNSPTATICSGLALNIPLTSNIPSSFSWIATNNPNTTGESITAQNSTTINNTIIDNTTSPQSIGYEITPTSTSGSCKGTILTMTVTVNPIPSGSGTSQTICSNQATNISLSSTVTGTTFTWPAPTKNNVIGGAAGSGTNINQILTSSPSNTTGTATYTITPNANGCIGSPISLIETVIPSPVVNVTGPANICAGSRAQLYADTHGSICTFLWSNGITNAFNFVTVPGTYTATVTNLSGCSSTSSPITVNPPIQSVNGGSITTTPTPCLNGFNSSLTLTTPDVSGATYQWSTGQNTNSITVTSPGNYTVIMTPPTGSYQKGCYDLNYCAVRVAQPDELDDYNVNEADSTDEHKFSQTTFYPNPADQSVTVELPQGFIHQTSIKMFDVNGHEMHNQPFEKGERIKVLSTHDFAGGVYLIQIEGQQNIIRKKIMVIHN